MIWAIWLIIVSTVQAIVISTERILHEEDGSYIGSVDIEITNSGSYIFQEYQQIMISGIFENQGIFAIDTRESTENLIVILNGKSFLNANSFTIHKEGTPRTTYCSFYYDTFNNTGTMTFDISAYSENQFPELGIAGIKETVNRGLIEVNNLSPKQGGFSFGVNEVMNSGIIKLHNYKYEQSKGRIIGSGCIYLDQGSEIFLDSDNSSPNQHFIMGDNSHIHIQGSSNVFMYHVSNFGRGSRVSVENSISSAVYSAMTGRLIVTSSSGIFQRFDIGKGYDEDLFSVSSGAVIYDGEIPGQANDDSMCKVYPADQPQEDPQVTTYTTIIEESQTTYTAEIIIANDEGGGWTATTYKFQETLYTTTYTDDDQNEKSVEAIVTTAVDGEWFTSSREILLDPTEITEDDVNDTTDNIPEPPETTDDDGEVTTSTDDIREPPETTNEVIVTTEEDGTSDIRPKSTTYTTTYIDEDKHTKTAKVVINKDEEDDWLTSTSDFELTKYRTTYTDDNENMITAEVIVTSDEEGNWYTIMNKVVHGTTTITETDCSTDIFETKSEEITHISASSIECEQGGEQRYDYRIEEYPGSSSLIRTNLLFLLLSLVTTLVFVM